MLIPLLIVAAVLLVLWNVRNYLSFTRDYAFKGSFAGRLYECKAGGLDSEGLTLCMMGADRAGLYIFPYPHKQKFFGNSGYGIFKKSLLIPWRDFTYCSKRVLFKDCIWFDLSPRKIWIYVPRDVGEKLLADGYREVPN